MSELLFLILEFTTWKKNLLKKKMSNKSNGHRKNILISGFINLIWEISFSFIEIPSTSIYLFHN